MTRDKASDMASRGQEPDAGEVAEMAETVAVLTSGLDAVGRGLEQHHVSDVEQAASRCADDRDFAAVWQRASRRARIEALTTVASLVAQVMPWAQTTTQTGASIGGARPDGPVDGAAGALLACAVQERRVPVPMSGPGLFGPLTGPTVAAAAGLVRDGGIGERDQRVVFAVLGLHAFTTDHDQPERGRDAR